ncbi:conserved membrane protein of unknown function [Nitrospira sp. KM1]|uniref:hypothetical protein n=1 Tax=Nitrospira sp. KM1 TaxID=1936990 RepID=UPI0013A77509|nr:hypothetical protein [Nitrospira sp. KM1]BCA55396.1 conserved membrane protein of unknown function [Nitrospira sp. KM1]
MTISWSSLGNALLGSLVVTVGGWLAWDAFPLLLAILLFTAVTAFLIWKGTTAGLVWAWSTLFLGAESFAWPVVTMIQVRTATQQPSDEQMGTILSAALIGLFSSVFWLAFSYGLFKRAGTPSASVTTAEVLPPATPPRRRNRR